MVDAEQAEDGGLEIVDGDGVLDDAVAEIVGGAVGEAGADAAAGQEGGEAAGVMVAAVIGGRELALLLIGAAELAAPDHQRVIQHAALFQVGD